MKLCLAPRIVLACILILMLPVAAFGQQTAYQEANAGTYNNRGIAKQKKGDLNGAMADFNPAIKLGSQSIDIVETPH